MMFRPTCLAALSLTVLALSGCGKSDTVQATNESAASVNEKLANSDLRMRPGKWESHMKIDKLEMAGLPPEATAQMQKAMGVEQTVATCITQAQVEKPNTEMFKQASAGCQYENFTMAGGKIDARMTCNRGPAPSQMVMSGTYGTDEYNVTMTTQASADANMPMKMTMSVASKRIGECDGKEG
jgi:hypothetical protein